MMEIEHTFKDGVNEKTQVIPLSESGGDGLQMKTRITFTCRGCFQEPSERVPARQLAVPTQEHRQDKLGWKPLTEFRACRGPLRIKGFYHQQVQSAHPAELLRPYHFMHQQYFQSHKQSKMKTKLRNIISLQLLLLYFHGSKKSLAYKSAQIISFPN